MRPLDLEVVQHGNDVCDVVLRPISGGLMRFVARPVPTSVDQDELMPMTQPVHIAKVVPALDAVGKTMLEHQWCPLAFEFVVDTDTSVVRACHWASPRSEERRVGKE